MTESPKISVKSDILSRIIDELGCVIIKNGCSILSCIAFIAKKKGAHRVLPLPVELLKFDIGFFS